MNMLRMLQRIIGLCFVGAWLFLLGLGDQKVIAEEAYITKPSKYSVLTTIDRLERRVKKKGLSVFARINHAAGAEKAGLKLQPSEVLIFGNPKMGTALIKENPAMGLILPLRVLSYQGPQGKTWITYLKPQAMLKNSTVAQDKDITGKMTKALDGLTRWASGY